MLIQSIFFPFEMFSSRRDGIALQTQIIGPTYEGGTNGSVPYVDTSTILDGDPRSPRRVTTSRVPIAQTPHFRFLAGESAAYEAYWNRFRDSKLSNDHSPEAFVRLAQKFRYLEAPHEDRYIILRPDGRGCFVVLDGVHRAAILQHQGQSRWIAAITA